MRDINALPMRGENNKPRTHWWLPLAVILCGIVAALAANASASHSLVDRISLGASGGNGAFDAQFRSASANGTIAFFETEESLVATDTDTEIDIYQRDSGGVTTLLSTGPNGGNGAISAFFKGSSTNGGRVFFETAESLVVGDTDSQVDVYERSSGTTSLVSTGGNAAVPAVFRGSSDDGTHIFFETTEVLAVGDTDSQTDVYDRSGGTTTRVSAGAINGNGAFSANFVDSSSDGLTVLFDTREQLISADTDALLDIYQRTGGVTTLISTGSTNLNPSDAFFAGASTTAASVFFHTKGRLVSGDTDSSFDVYQRTGTTTTLVSAGAINGNGAFDALLHLVSDDGSRVVFETNEQLVAADSDTQPDVYERASATTNLVSTGPATGPGTFVATSEGITPDGARIYFETTEPLVAEDTDSQTDVYVRSGGVTTLLSTGPDGGNGAKPASFDGVSSDGSRVFFHTDESLVSVDSDSFGDVYERSGGATTIISGGLTGGNGPFFTDFFGSSTDGTRVFLHTEEALTNNDTDADCLPEPGVQGCQDVYVATIAPSYPRVATATPNRVPLVPAYNQCTSPNTTHVAPKLSPGPGSGDPACAPPVLTSGQLTQGTAGAGFGFAKLTAIIGNSSTAADEADIGVNVTATDVRKRSDSTDYTGKLLLATTLRITDTVNGSAQRVPATVQDAVTSIPLDCTATGGPNGAVCSVSSTMDTLVPNFSREGKLTLFSLLSVELKDAGADGNVIVAGCPPTCGTGDETTFLREGVVTP